MDYPERSFQAMPLNISNTLYQAALPLADRAANLVG
jgi:hypothetical protein